MSGWLTMQGSAEYCDVSKKTIANWINKEGLRVSRVNRKLLLVKTSDLDKFLEGFCESNTRED